MHCVFFVVAVCLFVGWLVGLFVCLFVFHVFNSLSLLPFISTVYNFYSLDLILL